ncbi:MAG: nickel-dependent hydrogenase large subunit [Firmicutes bacterium]|nr:nickel-dependent hydrogenase large subunit [Bacillota bacterium]
MSDAALKKDVNVYVDYLARCEGETALILKVSADGEIREFKVNLYEPPRFFEGFLVGRKWYDAYETCSRICGICSVPHTISGIQATERAFGVEPSEQTKLIRKLATLSELNMNSIVTIFILGGPDFLGVNSVIDLAAKPEYLELVKTALTLKRLGNDITDFSCGRETHPITMDVGRQLAMPDKKLIDPLLERLREAKEAAWKIAEVVKSLKMPDYKRKVDLLAIHQDDEYAMNYGNLISTDGLDVDPEEHDKVLGNKHVGHSNALFYYLEGEKTFMAGPIARVVLNWNQLSPDARALAEKFWGGPEWFHENMPFSVYPAHAVEYMHTVDEMADILQKLKEMGMKDEKRPKAVPKAGKGTVITEAPRGILYYSFEFDEKGDVTFADIVTPTAHHVYNLEKDLEAVGPSLVGMSDEEAKLTVEMVARTYDLCCSCACHCVTMTKRKA